MTTSLPLTSRIRRLLDRDDAGSALVITMMVLAIVTGLGTTVYVMSVRNLQNAQRDRQATAALSDAEAGVGQAVAYIRANGVAKLRCAPNCNATNPWGEEPSTVDGDANPSAEVSIATGETYQVWIEPLIPFVPGSGTDGRYRIHSIGQAGTGPGTRTVVQDVSITPFSFPLAVYADQVNAGGTGQILTESMFSNGCIFKRSKIQFSGVDPVYHIPSAAHSSKNITDSQTGGNSCADTDNKNIHAPNNATANPEYCNSTYPYDQDAQGGDLSTYANPCYLSGSAMAGSTAYPKTSFTNNVAKDYGFQQSGLTSAQLDILRTAAQEQGFYFTNTTAVPYVLHDDVAAQQYPNPVVFYDLKGSSIGGLVDLNDFSSVEYGRPGGLSETDPACTTHNVIVVVLNGNVRLNSNQVLVGSIFAMGPDPYGQVTKANGTSNLIGTIYARGIDLTGTANVSLDQCFLQNLPGNLLNVRPFNFREVDR
jgi:type II secretory pathway pseudopilin PulG